MADFWYDLGIDILADLISFALGAVATYFIVDHLLEKKKRERELAQAKPLAKSAISFRLWPILRVVIFSLFPLLRISQKKLKADFFKIAEENHFVFIFEEIERLIDIYGNRIPDDIQEDLMNFGYHAGDFCESISFIKINFEIVDKLEEWKTFPDDAKKLGAEAEALVSKLVERDLVPKTFAGRFKAARDIANKRKRA